MNLQVNLIFDTETRSASLLNVKSLSRMGMIIVPAILLTLAGIATIKTMVVKNAIASKEQQWVDMEGNRNRLAQLNQDINKMKVMVDHLEGFKSSTVRWSPVLDTIRADITDNMQLQQIKVSPTEIIRGTKKLPGFRMEISGDAYGPRANPSVLQLRRNFKEQDSLEKLVETADIESFVLSPGSTDHYIFKINVIMAATEDT
jgi:Tfp pilus assembly protein PilN